MAEFPALPIWTDAYLADCSHLSDAEHGRYLLLLFAMWRAPNQRLPNDDAWLARKFGKSAEEIVSELRPLIAEFCSCDGNWITQKRLLREWSYVKRTSSRQSAAAKARWNNNKPQSHGNAERHTSGNAPTPTPTPTISKKELKNGGNGKVLSTESRSAPRHGATGRGFTYFKFGSTEWVAHAADFREVRGFDPVPDRDGGKWFRTLGEDR